MRSKLIAMLLTVSLILCLFVGCSQPEQPQQTAAPEVADETSAAAQEAVPAAEPAVAEAPATEPAQLVLFLIIKL